MRKVCHAIGVILVVLVSGVAAAPQQGTITAIAVSPTTADTGVSVTATVTGTSGVCGAVEINWGDGDTITYPTSYLPVTQAHVYKTAGTFTVRARGIANCAGDASTRLVITPPPAPPTPAPAPPPGTVTGVEIDAAAPRLGDPVTITVKGTGACTILIDFDNGEERRVTERLPYRLTYTFSEVGAHEVFVWTEEPCTGSGEAVVRVRRR